MRYKLELPGGVYHIDTRETIGEFGPVFRSKFTDRDLEFGATTEADAVVMSITERLSTKDALARSVEEVQKVHARVTEK